MGQLSTGWGSSGSAGLILCTFIDNFTFLYHFHLAHCIFHHQPKLSSRFQSMSGYTEDYIKNKLQEKLGAEHVEVVDQSDGCGGKFAALIVSNQFEGKALLARHRLVNSALEEELKTIHAFSQKTFTPEQWKQKQAAE